MHHSDRRVPGRGTIHAAPNFCVDLEQTLKGIRMAEHGLIGVFDLEEEIGRLAPGDTASRRRATILVKEDFLRVVLVTMLEGATLQDHSAPGPVTVQALTGHFLVTYGESERQLAPGGLICFAPGLRHAVSAISDGAFLLTIGWSPTVKEDHPLLS
jgi:quercetin dioxygenase-like cupin family protein